mmetsp:Transcript_66725/g.157463  ORF Transcript_66725/g.157463 Transcript_66725/m.157463 type:complete len:178 (-) Transcript_66725:110-643(-)
MTPSQIVQSYVSPRSTSDAISQRLRERQMRLDQMDLMRLSGEHAAWQTPQHYSPRSARGAGSPGRSRKLSRRQWAAERPTDRYQGPSGVFLPSSANPALESQRMYITTVHSNEVVNEVAPICTNRLNSAPTGDSAMLPELEPVMETAFPAIQALLDDPRIPASAWANAPPLSPSYQG